MEVIPGVTALLHSSASGDDLSDPAAFAIGQSYEVVITEIDRENRGLKVALK
jgi:ribosomal protein S1